MSLGTAATLDRVLVLGPGGVLGTAWMAGLAAGLRRAGVDLGEADLTVGTSAGAIVGALLATGQDLDRLAAPARKPAPAVPEAPAAPRRGADPAVMGSVFAVLGEAGLEPGRPGAASAGSRSTTRAPTPPPSRHCSRGAAP